MIGWIVFYYEDKELCAYTLRGTFLGEREETKKLLAYEHGISYDDITVKVEYRSA